VVSRLGGDEFLVVCPNTDEEGGAFVAELLRRAVAELRVSIGGDGCWHGSVSVGLAVRTPDMESCHDLLRSADASVYAAKRAGKNCVRTLS
jgi:hemerythrin